MSIILFLLLYAKLDTRPLSIIFELDIRPLNVNLFL